ncbi:MAG: FHA domain-containing protein [Isosphaeraceae bacterium]
MTVTSATATATNPFLQACGATGPLTLAVELPGASARDVRALDQPFALVGRDPRCDLRLDHPEVSERHAYLQLVGGRLVCIDLGSRNGVMQGGRRSRLIDVDRSRPIRIGPYRIRLLAGDLDGDPRRDEPRLAERLSASLDLSHRALRQSRCDLPPGLALVGSGADAQIRLIDPSVSTYHCSLVHTSGGVWAVDLLGQGGVRRNGHEVGYARLYDGDVVQVGHSEIRLADGTGGSRPAVVESSPPRPAVIEPVPVVMPEPEPQVFEVADPNPAPPPVATAAAVMPASEVAFLPPAHVAELVERLVSPIVDEVGRIRQQMVDDFQQARLMLFDTVATLHQEQSTFLNHELEQLRQLSQELNALRDSLQKQSEALAVRLDGLEPGAGAASTPAPAPTRLGSAVSTGPVITGSTLPTLGSVSNPSPPASAPAVALPKPFPSPRPGGHEESIHAQLCDRIARIKNEHQSRWQKLLGLFPSAAQGKPAG